MISCSSLSASSVSFHFSPDAGVHVCCEGSGPLRGVHQQPAGVEADPPPLFLGAHVDPLLPAGVAAGLPLRRPAVQGEPLVQGKVTSCSSGHVLQRVPVLRVCLLNALWTDVKSEDDGPDCPSCPPQAIYVYQKAAILSMMSEEDVRKTGEDLVELFRLLSLHISK